MKNHLILVVLIGLSQVSLATASDRHEHETIASDIEINEQQRRLAGIETILLRNGVMGEAVRAPGEVMLNAYHTSRLTPRIQAQIVKRHVHLGDKVHRGQIMVTLSSIDMAVAQGALIEANAELHRVESMGTKVVSVKRLVAAKVAYQQAYARVLAYGLSTQQANTLLKRGDATQATGIFRLLALQDGTVIRDDFVTGELINPGRTLLEISDELQPWVAARVTPEEASRIDLASSARIQVGGRWLTGKVVQIGHVLDEITRTQMVRIEVNNKGDVLHRGRFVTAVLETRDKRKGLLAPLAAVLRNPDGDWMVLVETSPGRFEPWEIMVLHTAGDQALIGGIEEGATIISKGAFFVQSELAKSGFSVHNH